MTTPDIHTVRQAIADDIVKIASECANSEEELLEHLSSINQPHYQLGLGHTRRTWQLDHGLVLKVARTDALGAPHRRLERRNANFAELVSSGTWPSISPRVYGALLAFGPTPSNPSILISEQVKPMSDDPAVTAHAPLFLSDFSVSVGTGKLLRTPTHPHDIPLDVLLGFPENMGISPLNVGTNADGDFVILDFGGFMVRDVVMDMETFQPVGLERLQYEPAPTYNSEQERNQHISAHLMAFYRARLLAVQASYMNVFPINMQQHMKRGVFNSTVLQRFSDALAEIVSKACAPAAREFPS